jgi:GcrA cell cycle regulator
MPYTPTRTLGHIGALLGRWSAGATTQDLAASEGVHRHTIYEWFKTHPDYAAKKAEREAPITRADMGSWEALIPQLRVLWAEGHSTAEIGRRLGVTKNAVISKAHRLHLPPRPSPIRRNIGGGVTVITRTRALPSGAASLPPLASGVVAVVEHAQAAPKAVIPAPASAPAVAAPRPYGRAVTCCWPIGEPGTPSFRFCVAEVALREKLQRDGSVVSVRGVYCGEHAARATVRTRDRREEAG